MREFLFEVGVNRQTPVLNDTIEVFQELNEGPAFRSDR